MEEENEEIRSDRRGEGLGDLQERTEFMDARTVVIAGLLLLSFVLAIALLSKDMREKRDLGLPMPDCSSVTDYDAPESSGSGTSEEKEEKLGLGFSFFIGTLCTCVIGSHLISKHSFTTLPMCILYVFAGVFVGTTLRLMGVAATAGYALPNQEQFFLFIIPPIIFEAGYSLNKKDFFGQAGAILLFAVLGTLITAVLFGSLLFVTGVLHLTYFFRFWEALTFGALISAVDPVATIAIFNAMKVNKTLHYLVFGESVLNDGIAIVLYHTFGQMIGPDKPHWYVPIVSFFYIFIGSTIVGGFCSFIAALILKNTSMYKTPVLELSFYLLMAFLPYFLCEGLRMSGIVGILTNSMLLAHYGRPNLSQVGELSSTQVFRSIAFLTETFVFIYLGFALTSFNHAWNTLTVIVAIFLTLLSRAANVYPLAFVANHYRKEGDKITGKTQFLMFFSGLRGAIAFALSLNFPGGNEETRRVVISTTLLLRVEGISATATVTAARVNADEFEVDISEAVEVTEPTPEEDIGWIRKLDRFVLRPLLVTADPTRHPSEGEYSEMLRERDFSLHVNNELADAADGGLSSSVRRTGTARAP